MVFTGSHYLDKIVFMDGLIVKVEPGKAREKYVPLNGGMRSIMGLGEEDADVTFPKQELRGK